MTTNKLRKTIDQAVELDREIKLLEADLKALKDVLKTEATTREEEHTATAGGGWSWEAPGESGAICRVTQEGDRLKGTISTEKDVAALKELAGPGAFRALFVPAVSYKPIDKVREMAAELLEKPVCRKLLKVLTGKGSMKVGFETKGGEA